MFIQYLKILGQLKERRYGKVTEKINYAITIRLVIYIMQFYEMLRTIETWSFLYED